MRDTRYDEIFLYFKEEGHKYNDSLGNSYTSVTTLIHDNYVPKFNKKYWLHKKARELGVSEKTLEKQWQAITDEACARGTVTHNGLEDAIKEVSMFKSAIQYLNNISDGRVVTVADIPFFKAKPLDIEKFKEATNNKYPEIYRVFQFYIDRGCRLISQSTSHFRHKLLPFLRKHRSGKLHFPHDKISFCKHTLLRLGKQTQMICPQYI